MLKLGQQQAHAGCKRRKAVLSAFLILIFFIVLLQGTEGSRKQTKQSRRTKKSRAGVGKDFSEFLLVIGTIMTCVIGPVFLFFLHSIYKDPAVPELAREAWKVVKDKLFSYLGGQQPAVPDSSIEPNDAHTTSSASRTAQRRNVDIDENRDGTRPISSYTNSGDSRVPREGTDVGADISTMAPNVDISARYRSYAVHPDRPTGRDRRQPVKYINENDDYTRYLSSHSNARSNRRNLRITGERGDKRSAPRDVAPFSSGALPTKAVGSGLGIRGGGDNEVEGTEFARLRGGSPRTWQDGRGKEPDIVAHGARDPGEEKSFDNFGPPWGIDGDPYMDYAGFGGKDVAYEPLINMEHQGPGVYKKSAQSKRRTTRNKRARAVTSFSAGATNLYDGGGGGRRIDDGE